MVCIRKMADSLLKGGSAPLPLTSPDRRYRERIRHLSCRPLYGASASVGLLTQDCALLVLGYYPLPSGETKPAYSGTWAIEFIFSFLVVNRRFMDDYFRFSPRESVRPPPPS